MGEYSGEEFEVKERLMLISIGVSFYRMNSPYDAVRYAWKINRGRVERYKLVLASLKGMIVGAYRPTEWLPATKDNFPDLLNGYPDFYSEAPERYGFVGEPAETADWNYYVGKRVPDRYRPRGAANPIRYCDVGDKWAANGAVSN